MFCDNINIYYRSACAIPDGDSVILTGGRYTKQTVSRYDSTGYVGNLADLRVGRYNHGCGSYLRHDGTKVSIGFVISLCLHQFIQVFLVAGGWADDTFPFWSTEILEGVDRSWIMNTPMPRALSGMRGLTLDNILYMTGGSY